MNWRACRVFLLIGCLFYFIEQSAAVSFDTSLLAGDSSNSDLSRFNEDQVIPPGYQEMDIYVNGHWKGYFLLLFDSTDQNIFISKKEAHFLGIKLPASTDNDNDYSLYQLVQGGRYDIDISTLSIQLTVPQHFVIRSEAGYIDPEFWDEGESALLLSYNSTYYHSSNKKGAKTQNDEFYTGLESGINLAGWQFRDSSTLQKSSGEQEKWQNNTRYVRKPIASLTSNFMAGDFYSPGTLFDSVKVRAVSLSSDIKMRPNSQQGFAPIVRGVAQSNALVKVMQSGSVIYQENVPPGPFTIEHIQPTGSAGDLLVVVKEADGEEQSFTVPFSSFPGMLKEGVVVHNLVAGKVHQRNSDYEPTFAQGTIEYGFSNLLTAYIGSIFSEKYQAYLVGTGWNLPFGAISLDVTHADTKVKEQRYHGQSMRIAYSKFIDSTETNFTLAAYRYSTKGYYTFSDAIYANSKQDNRWDDDIDQLDLNRWDSMRSVHPKNTFSLNLNQRLNEGWGTVYFSGTQRDYWTDTQQSREYQFGYANAYLSANYSVSVSRVRTSRGDEETRYYFSLSMPFSMLGGNTWISTGMSATGSHYQQSTVSLNGSALESQRLSYSLSGSNQSGGENMGSANVSYRTNMSTLGGSWSESNDYRQTSLSARGSLVAIPWHILTANEVGNTLMIVNVPDAKGIIVNGDHSIMTNSDGLALVPYATPYRKNTITLSNTPDSSGAELLGNIGNTVPYDGSINIVHFRTDSRQSWIFSALSADDKPLPFGAEVTDGLGVPIGYVGQSSVLYIKAEQQPDTVIVRIRNGQCQIDNPPASFDSDPVVCH